MQIKMEIGKHSEKSTRCGRNETGGQTEVHYCLEKRKWMRDCQNTLNSVDTL
jgi:hypothetical protein